MKTLISYVNESLNSNNSLSNNYEVRYIDVVGLDYEYINKNIQDPGRNVDCYKDIIFYKDDHDRIQEKEDKTISDYDEESIIRKICKIVNCVMELPIANDIFDAEYIYKPVKIDVKCPGAKNISLLNINGESSGKVLTLQLNIDNKGEIIINGFAKKSIRKPKKKPTTSLKGCIRCMTWDLPEVVRDGSKNLDYYNSWDLGQDDGDEKVDPKEFNKRLAAFHKMVKDADTVDLGNWFGESEEEWEYFYKETRIKPSQKVMVLHQDGDDATFAYIIFKSFKQKVYDEFREMLRDDFDVYINF